MSCSDLCMAVTYLHACTTCKPTPPTNPSHLCSYPRVSVSQASLELTVIPLSSGFQPRRKQHSEQRAASVPPLWRHPGMPWFSHLIFLPASSALATQLKRHGPNPASTSVSMNLQHRNRVGMIRGQQGHDSQTVPAAEVRLLPAVVGRVPQRWPSAGQGTRRPTTRA